MCRSVEAVTKGSLIDSCEGYRAVMTRMFHVTSAANRTSIDRHGLDWSRMSGARGIAGSRLPEVDGIFLSQDRFTAEFFVRMNNTGGPVDMWTVDDVDEVDLVQSDSGFFYVPFRIERGRLTLEARGLLERNLPPAVRGAGHRRGSR